jgi:hypothetical protein
MNQLLLSFLIAVDCALIALVLVALRRRKPDQSSITLLREVDHEHRLLKELRDSVRDELQQKHAEMKILYEKVSMMATETEMELRSGGQSLSHELEAVLTEARSRLEEDLEQVDKRRTHLSALLKKAKEERQLLQKALQRGERLAQFFDGRVPYQEVLDDIEDKKYVDARQLLAKGLAPLQVAKELGLAESEVQLIATMG